MTYEPVIGLEVHVELNTKAKMFCRCSTNYFGQEPNTHVCPVCLGLPGALPYINKAAIEDCIKIGLALNCSVAEISRFERKNYFYADLPKGYQISQYRWPLCVGGHLTLSDGTRVRINRAHQEEDTGKLSHIGSETLIDYNRSSVPLTEIVTEPDFTKVEQIKDYAQKLQQIFRYLGVSNADMEKGDMRLEANISVRPVGQTTLPSYRVELKNINSFKFMMTAVEYEIKRQIEALEKGEKLIQETRGWDEAKKVTFTQRVKEEANDYRYFPEPDLPELRIDRKWVEEIKGKLPELASEKIQRFKDWGVKRNDAKILSEIRQMAELFELAVAHGKKHGVSPQAIANYIINEKWDVKSPAEIIKEILEKKSGIIDDQETLEKLCYEIIAENPNIVAEYKKGKITVLEFFVGQVARETQGKADINRAREILKKLLE